jgi:hypothetical protein
MLYLRTGETRKAFREYHRSREVSLRNLHSSSPAAGGLGRKKEL